MTETIKMCFVGCGGFAQRYHVPALLQADNVSIDIICDPIPAESTRQLADQVGAEIIGSIDSLPSATGTCAAICSSPHTLHADHARQLLERGYHTLVDKPFVMQLQQAQSLAALGDMLSLVNGVAFTRRFDRACLRAKQILKAGGIGPIRFVQSVQLGYERAGWFLDPSLGGGGPFTGRAAHIADLVPWLTSCKPRRLRSRLRGGSDTRTDAGGFIELVFEEFECHMTCVEEGLHMWDEVRVFGDDGFIEMRRPLDLPIGWSLAWHSQRGEKIEWLKADPTPGDATRNFIDAVLGMESIACSFADAALSVEIIERAFACAQQAQGWHEF